MTSDIVDVKIKGKVVSQVTVEKFDTLDEAVDHYNGDELTVIALVNRQHKADTTNAERAKFRPSTASKKKLRQLAFEMCVNDAELNAQLQGHMGDYDGMQEFLDSLAEQVKAGLASGAVVSTEPEDDTDTE